MDIFRNSLIFLSKEFIMKQPGWYRSFASERWGHPRICSLLIVHQDSIQFWCRIKPHHWDTIQLYI